MTLDDLERTKRHSCKNKQFFYGAQQKNVTEYRPVLSAAKIKAYDSSF